MRTDFDPFTVKEVVDCNFTGSSVVVNGEVITFTKAISLCSFFQELKVVSEAENDQIRKISAA